MKIITWVYNKTKCNWPNCNKRARRSYVSKHGVVQRMKYCITHARLVKMNGAFKNCKLAEIKYLDRNEPEPHLEEEKWT